MNRNYKILLFLLYCMTVSAAKAQHKTFSFSAGAGLAYVARQKLHTQYTPVVTANVSASMVASLSRNIFVETGIGYRRKGFRGYSQLIDDDEVDKYYSKARYDYIGIPLTLNGTIMSSGNNRLSIGGGMVYNFMLRGGSEIHHDAYIKGRLVGGEDYAYHPRLGLVQSKRKEIDLYLFDTGLKFQVEYVYRNRWLLQVFHEHSLYSFVANAHDGSSLKQRYTGVAVGIVVP